MTEAGKDVENNQMKLLQYIKCKRGKIKILITQ